MQDQRLVLRLVRTVRTNGSFVYVAQERDDTPVRVGRVFVKRHHPLASYEYLDVSITASGIPAAESSTAAR